MDIKNELNKRQEKILAIIDELGMASISQIAKQIRSGVSEITLKRDLALLFSIDVIERHGAGRSTAYSLSQKSRLLKPIDIDNYFKKEMDNRAKTAHFNFNIMALMKDIFTNKELNELDELNSTYQKNIKKLSEIQLKKEFERLTIELSWKSSHIEGNTYTLLETEQLLKEKHAAKNRTKEETQMILNHKTALDAVKKNAKRFNRLTDADIEHVHSLLTKNLNISKNIRKRIVRITGTNYIPPDNEHQIREALEKMCKLINKEPSIWSKALLTTALISYIQPFEDGNKRTSRLIGNAVLLAHNCCPLSYRSIDEVEYKKAMILFYEQNNLFHVKRLFMEQFEFAVNNYFGA